jgi:hypothetical protein
MGLARGLGPKSSKIVHFKCVHCNFPILGSKKAQFFGDFSYHKPFFHPDGVFLEQLIHKQICSQYRKLQFFGLEDLCQNIFLKVISCSVQIFFSQKYSSGGSILTYSMWHKCPIEHFFTIPDVEHYLNLQKNV